MRMPWLENYGKVPHSLDYPDGSMIDCVEKTAQKYPQNTAYSFMGKRSTYRELMSRVDQCARALAAMGIKRGDKVMLCLPNIPQTVACFYAINKIGAVAVMIHPLSSEGEIKFFIENSGSKLVVTLDQFFKKFDLIRGETALPDIVVANIKDALGAFKRVGYTLTEGRKNPKIQPREGVIIWDEFIKAGQSYTGEYCWHGKADETAVILYSGGTTGTMKGILLSNLNFNALALQTDAMSQCLVPGKSMLAVMPAFHGFGLGVCIHTMLVGGCECILVPRFNANSYAGLLKKLHPNYIAGVPTLFEALLKNESLGNADLSCLMGVFSGGDSLSIELKKKFDAFLKQHNAKIRIREGYGTTECVTASCLTPSHLEKEGSIGLPFTDMLYKIVGVGKTEELPYGQIGEICISGPTVMSGYLNMPEETKQTLRLHEDGRVWLHTGDLGTMDEQGFVYFKQRIKRMIVSSGYSIYPSQLENVVDAHPDIQMSCAIGIPHPYKMQAVKIFAVPRKGVEDLKKLEEELWEYCRKNIAKYAMPVEIELRSELPKTGVGKVAYTVLEKEELEKRKNVDS